MHVNCLIHTIIIPFHHSIPATRFLLLSLLLLLLLSLLYCILCHFTVVFFHYLLPKIYPKPYCFLTVVTNEFPKPSFSIGCLVYCPLNRTIPVIVMDGISLPFPIPFPFPLPFPIPISFPFTFLITFPFTFTFTRCRSFSFRFCLLTEFRYRPSHSPVVVDFPRFYHPSVTIDFVYYLLFSSTFIDRSSILFSTTDQFTEKFS